MHAFGLMAVLIKLITQYGDGDRKRADDKIKHIGANHGGVPRRNHFLADRQSSSSADSCRNSFNHMGLPCDVRLFFAIASKAGEGPHPVLPSPRSCITAVMHASPSPGTERVLFQRCEADVR